MSMLTNLPENIRDNLVMPSRSILVVEDDPFMQKNFQHVIKSIDPLIKVECVETAEEAQTILGKSGAYFYDLVVADQILGGQKTGIDLWRECKDSFPPMSFILTSGRKWKTIFTSRMIEETSLPPFLPKPFKQEDCRRMMSAMLDLSPFAKAVSNSEVVTNKEEIPHLSWSTLAVFYTFLVWSVIIIVSRVDEVYLKTKMASAHPTNNGFIKTQELPKMKIRMLPEKSPALKYKNDDFDRGKFLSELSIAASKISARADQILKDTADKTWVEVDQN
jgi:DNA-binding NarL/FixJ family response regulator